MKVLDVIEWALIILVFPFYALVLIVDKFFDYTQDIVIIIGIAFYMSYVLIPEIIESKPKAK